MHLALHAMLCVMSDRQYSVQVQIAIYVCRLATAPFRWLLNVTIHIACSQDGDDDSRCCYHPHHHVDKQSGQ